MTGRGIDQILPHPGAPHIYEDYMKSALGYVKLAELVNGPLQKPVGFEYIWGDALNELQRVSPDARVINLETTITKSEDYEDKGINYRMNPENIPCITSAGIDCCALANNHVLDWGYSGLAETLETLRRAGVKSAGAGMDLKEAEDPAVIEMHGKGRVVVFCFGSVTSGIPLHWAASEDSPGVNLLKSLSGEEASHIREQVLGTKQPGDIVIASIHWGGNWGYEIPHEQREFAHMLIDKAGVDIVHGHSSHHAKGIEVYRERLILYGCGDFLNDYEGISGYEYFRADLGLMYFAEMDPSTGKLAGLRMTPTQVKRFRVNRASGRDFSLIMEILNREGGKFGTRVTRENDTLLLSWAK